jgi:hypothetical protein
MLIGTWVMLPMTGAIKFDQGGKYYPTIYHGDCSKKITVNGAAAYGSLPPPVGRPRPFRSTVHDDRVMGNPPYYWCHQNQAGVQALRYNPPW